MTDTPDFEGRLRESFRAEADALRNRAEGESPTVDATASAPSRSRDVAVPWIAAALVLVLGAGIGLFLRGVSPEPVVPVASSPPEPLVTATPTATSSPASLPIPTAGEPLIHLVQEGDLLSTIATRYNVSPDALLRANPHIDPNVLLVGDRLRIPGAVRSDVEPTPSSPTPVPTPASAAPTPTPMPTPVSPTPAPTPLAELAAADAYCLTRDVGFVAPDACGIVPIGEVVDGRLAVQQVNGVGQVSAAVVPIDALAPGPAIAHPGYFPGLLEDTWCVTGISAPDTLNVRQGPSVDREILGELSEGQCGIWRTANGELPFAGWTPISVDRPGDAPLVGWVADAYLRRDAEALPSDVPLRFITVRVEGLGSGLQVPPIEAFEFVDGDTILGRAEPGGSLGIPADLDPIGLVAQAPAEEDRFCAWTGSIETTDNAGFHVLRAAMLCA